MIDMLLKTINKTEQYLAYFHCQTVKIYTETVFWLRVIPNKLCYKLSLLKNKIEQIHLEFDLKNDVKNKGGYLFMEDSVYIHNLIMILIMRRCSLRFDLWHIKYLDWSRVNNNTGRPPPLKYCQLKLN